MKSKIKIYYDGGCIFCNNYIQLTKLKEDFDVILISFRDNVEIVEKFCDMGINVDDGMVIEHNEKIYFGAKAMIFLSKYDNSSSIYNTLINLLFRLNLFPNFIYNSFKFIRSLVLKLMGVSLIVDSKKVRK